MFNSTNTMTYELYVKRQTEEGVHEELAKKRLDAFGYKPGDTWTVARQVEASKKNRFFCLMF